MPLVRLGFPAPAINTYVMLVGIQAVLAHANLRINVGWRMPLGAKKTFADFVGKPE